MAMKPRLDLRQAQTLTLTPQLQQAIKLLALSSQELSAYIEAELEQNPLLERDDAADDEPRGAEAESLPADSAAAEAPPDDLIRGLDADKFSEVAASGDDEAELWPVEPADSDMTLRLDARMSGDDGAAGGAFDNDLREAANLRDHLLAQLSVDLADPMDRLIGLHLIGSLDDAGYVSTELQAIAEQLGCDVPRIEATLGRMQAFDPPGVFARDLAECLALQLRDRDRLDPAMA